MRKRYQVFVSSTYVDLIEEREEAVQAILKAGCFPAGMELFPAADESQWDMIKETIDESDFYVLIIAGRYGSTIRHGRKIISYTEKEFEYAKKTKKTILAFIYENPEELPEKRVDLDHKTELAQFREKIKHGRIVEFWRSKEELRAKILEALTHAVDKARGSCSGWVKYEPEMEWIKKRETVSNFIKDARRTVFITGNTLQSLYDANTELKRLMEKGVTVRLVLLSDHQLEYNCNQLGAPYERMKKSIEITLARLKKYHEKDWREGRFEVREVTAPLWTNIISRDTDETYGVIGATHLLYDVETENCLYIELHNGEQFYPFYRKHMEAVWDSGIDVDFDKVTAESL